MNRFYFSHLAMLLLPFFAISYTHASGPNDPALILPIEHLGEVSLTALAEIEMETQAMDPEMGEVLYQNLLILSQNRTDVPLLKSPNYSLPLEGMWGMEWKSLKAIRKVTQEQVKLKSHCSCDAELAFWLQLRELIKWGFVIKARRGNREQREKWEEQLRKAEQRGDTEQANWLRGALAAGDPHIRTYDGKHYSLQTVGEYVLTKSTLNEFEVQTRQSAIDNAMSVNTSVAMNVRGDRVCIYGETWEYPDTDVSTPLRVNGEPVPWENGEVVLDNGGMVRVNNNSAIVHWPTGERVSVSILTLKSRKYLSIGPGIQGAKEGLFEGLMGNANGNEADDLQLKDGTGFAAPREFYTLANLTGKKGVSPLAKRAEREYHKGLAKQFGESWRVTDATSLFDYAPGKNTASYTRSDFPSIFVTLSDIGPEAARKAKKQCEASGVKAEFMRECISDVHFSKDNSMAESFAQFSDAKQWLETLGLPGMTLPPALPRLSEVEIKAANKKLRKPLAQGPIDWTTQDQPKTASIPKQKRAPSKLPKPQKSTPKPTRSPSLPAVLEKVIPGVKSLPSAKPKPGNKPKPVTEPTGGKGKPQMEQIPVPNPKER